MYQTAPRYQLGRAIERLNKMLGLRPSSQDFELEAMDPSRVREFCDVYVAATLDAEERFALMTLIVASLDGRLEETPAAPSTEQVAARVHSLLERDYAMHFHTVEYWACLDEPDSQRRFAVSACLRELWFACTPPLLLALRDNDIDPALFVASPPVVDSALMRAAELSLPGALNALIVHGASLRARDYAGQTPLHFAVHEGGDEVARMLLAAGSEPNAQDNYGRPPLVVAAMGGHLGIAKRLLAAGADVDIADYNGYAPIHSAAQAANLEMVELLLTLRPEQGPTRNGHTPGQLAARHESPELNALFES